MAFNFPENPQEGSTYRWQDLVWIYNGTSWKKASVDTNDSTGILSGGILSANIGGTTFNVSAGYGQIIGLTATDNAVYGNYKYVEWDNYTGISVDNLNTHQFCYVYIDEDGQLNQQTTPFTTEQYERNILIGTICHIDYTAINLYTNTQHPAYGLHQRFRNLIDVFGPMKKQGLELSPNGTNLRINRAAGEIYKTGAKYNIDQFQSDVFQLDAATPASSCRLSKNLTGFTFDTNNGLFYQDIDPGHYNLNGTSIAIVNNNQWTIQRIFQFTTLPTDLIIYYGRQIYNSFSAARDALETEIFEEATITRENSAFLGYLFVRGGAIDLSNTSDAVFLQAGFARSIPPGGGGAGGGGEITGDYVISINGSTGAITNVARINEGNTFSVRQVMNAGITTANLQVSGGATFSTIYASSTTNTIDAIASTDGIGLRVARSIGGGPSSIGGILLGRSSISQYNYLLYTSTGTFYVINGTGPAASQLMTLNALDVNFNVPIRGATFSSTAGRITVQKSGAGVGGESAVVRIVGTDVVNTAYNSDIRANASAASDTIHTLPAVTGTLLNTASSYVISVNGQTGAVTISGGAGATGATGPTGPTEDNITLFIDANPDDITTGNKGYKQIAYDCQPIEWYVLAGQTGSIEFDVKKSSFASYPSTTSIVGTDNPELISQMKNSNTGITAWSGLSAGDIIDFVINSNTGIKSVGLFIKIRRTS